MNRITNEQCKMCGKVFPKRTDAVNRKYKKGKACNRVTCSKDCSKRYTILCARIYSKFNSKVKRLEREIKQLEGKLK